MTALDILDHLTPLLGSSLEVIGDAEGIYLRYDTEESDPKTQWGNYLEVVEGLREIGYEFLDPQIEHNCITGHLGKINIRKEG